MNRLSMMMLTSLVIVAPVFAGSKPPIPAVEPSFADPGTPEQRKAYKIAVLENEIAQDKYVIENPGGGKIATVQEHVSVAKENLKSNQMMLQDIKNGKDMDVYFCSMCGREYMKAGTCPHCKTTLMPLFDQKGHAVRPSTPLEAN